MGREKIRLVDQQWFNNLFIGGSGLKPAPEGRPGYAIDHNVYLDGVGKHPSLDQAGIAGVKPSGSRFKSESRSATLEFNADSAIFGKTCPRISSATIGKLSVSKMTIETPDGRPLEIATDYFGQPIQSGHVLPGPFQAMKAGTNSLNLWPRNK